MLARLGLAMVTAAVCFAGGRVLFAEQLAGAVPEELPLPPLPLEGRRDLTLLRVEGDVERGRPEKGFAPAMRGVPLEEGERLRVEGGARATLRLGVGSSLALEPGSEITALAAGPGEVTVRLDSGRARVTLEHPGRVLRVSSSEGGEVIARGPGARFLIAAHPGRLSLVNEGESAPVTLLAGGSEVEVPPKRVSWSVHGGVPRPPIEPPREPELEIASAVLEPAPSAAIAGEDEPAGQPLVVVSGRVHPLALVRVGGTVVDVAADGSFSARVPRQQAPYAVLASLPTGREALLEVPVPPLELEPARTEPEPARQKAERPKKKKRKGKGTRGRR